MGKLTHQGAEAPRKKGESEGVDGNEGHARGSTAGRVAGDADGSSDNQAEIEKPVSAKKLEANRANAQHSTGPKTINGKAKSAMNGYKHGLCAQHLLRPGPHRAQDSAAYEALVARVWNHYQPQGFMEAFFVEKIVTEMVRFSRIVGHEQQELERQSPFYSLAIDKILRYATSSDRQLMRTIQELERIQAARGPTSTAGSEAELDEAAQQIPTSDANWISLGSIPTFVESPGGQTVQSRTRGVSKTAPGFSSTEKGPTPEGADSQSEIAKRTPTRPLGDLVDKEQK